MRQIPEYRPLENSEKTSVWKDWIQRENKFIGQWADQLSETLHARLAQIGILPSPTVGSHSVSTNTSRKRPVANEYKSWQTI